MKNDNIHTNLLNAIYQTAEKNYLSIDHFEEKITDINLKEELKNQREEYKQISEETIKIFIKYGQDEKEISSLAKAISNFVSALKTMNEDKNGSIAKVLIEANNKEVLDLIRKLNEYSDEDHEIVNLANNLIKKITKNIEKLKTYI